MSEIMPPLPAFAIKAMVDYRHTLDLIDDALRKKAQHQMTPVLGLLLMIIGERDMRLRDIDKEFPMTSNISQPVQRLVAFGFATQQRPKTDKRSVMIRLTDQGLELCAWIRHDIARETTTT